MTTLPEPKPTAPAAGQATRDAAIEDAADKMLTALNAAIQEKRQPTAIRIEDPAIPSWADGARIGTTPPVDQPGRPSMSSKAVDDSVRMWSFGGMTVLVCGGVALVMAVSDRADPTAIGVFFGGIAVVALAIARLLRRAGQVAPAEIHQTYTGPVHVDQRNVLSKTTGIWVKNTNEQ
ncbi:hypothetical protein [Streptomyces sp. NBC_01373]|uniref:hypothetical protein n=1 Tax=Streptomyces sp. NBC_01373 TaxID=2903843 RepID=UPI002254EF73|nr:hypothetical protein [Streptomyces sp. NBC_01373]MCX4707071.1 hypothetical protein [Streptomyces sp. NBC_01373]